MVEQLQNFTESLPPLIQWLGIMLIAAIPFVESYLGSVIGVFAGLSPFVAIPAAVIGNVVSMLVFVISAHALRGRATRNLEPAELSPRRQKIKQRFDRYGVAGVSLMGQLVLPSQITSAALVSFCASRNAVIIWQVISIIMWGVVCGVLATLGITFVGGR